VAFVGGDKADEDDVDDDVAVLLLNA